MPRNRHISSNSSRQAKIPQTILAPIGGIAVASTAEVNQWYSSIEQLIQRVTANDEDFPFDDEACENFLQAEYNATNAAIMAIAGGGAVIAHVPHANPGIPGPEYTKICNLMAALVTPLITAAGGPPAVFPVIPAYVPGEITQAEFDSLILQFFIVTGHSGYSSHGQIKGFAQFFRASYPPAAEGYYEVLLSEIFDLIPQGRSLLNFANYHITIVAKYAKDNGVSFRWGETHGVPAKIGWAGTPAWPYIQGNMLTEEERLVMATCSEIAIRDQGDILPRDPATKDNLGGAAVEEAHSRLTNYHHHKSQKSVQFERLNQYRFPHPGAGGSQGQPQ